MPLGKALSNLIGFGDHNERMSNKKSDRQDRDYNFPRQSRHAMRGYYPPHGRFRGPIQPDPRRPSEPLFVHRNVGHRSDWVPAFQLDGHRIDRGPRYRPHHHYHAPFYRPSFDFPSDFDDGPGCDRCDDPHVPYWDQLEDEPIVDLFDDLSLGRRHSYERFRPMGHHDRRHLAPDPRFRHQPIQDHEGHPHQDCHCHHPGHQRQLAYLPHQSHPEHPTCPEHDEIDAAPGGHRDAGVWGRTSYPRGQLPDDSSDHGTASTW